MCYNSNADAVLYAGKAFENMFVGGSQRQHKDKTSSLECSDVIV